MIDVKHPRQKAAYIRRKLKEGKTVSAEEKAWLKNYEASRAEKEVEVIESDIAPVSTAGPISVSPETGVEFPTSPVETSLPPTTIDVSPTEKTEEKPTEEKSLPSEKQAPSPSPSPSSPGAITPRNEAMALATAWSHFVKQANLDARREDMLNVPDELMESMIIPNIILASHIVTPEVDPKVSAPVVAGIGSIFCFVQGSRANKLKKKREAGNVDTKKEVEQKTVVPKEDTQAQKFASPEPEKKPSDWYSKTFNGQASDIDSEKAL